MPIVFSVSLYGQDYYTGKTILMCDDVTYKVTHYSFTNDILVENQANCMRSSLRYKVASSPVIYYSEATGMGHFADSDSVMFAQAVREAFSDYEVRKYKKASGAVYLTYVINPDSGRVLEVRFDFWLPDNDLTLLSIPVEKLWKLESLIKQRMVCHIGDELRAEKQSYALSGDTMFSK